MRYILVLILGLVIGGGAAIYLLGVPSAKAIPGTVVQAPSDGQPAPVMVSINEKFFDEMLTTIFRDLGPPAFQLASADPPGSPQITPAAFQGGCTNSVTLAPEGSNVKTRVQFTGGKITSPLAFAAATFPGTVHAV